MQNMIESPCPSDVNITHESYHFGNPTTISSYQPELDQHQTLNILASYPFPKIELELESDPNLKLVIPFHFFIQ